MKRQLKLSRNWSNKGVFCTYYSSAGKQHFQQQQKRKMATNYKNSVGARNLFEANANFGRIMFNVGAPDEQVLQKVANLMQKATAKRLADEMSSGSHMMQYGAPAGDSRFLKALRQFLADEYADTVQIENLVQTAGASSGLYYILTQVFPEKCPIYCAEYTYFIALTTMRQLAFDITSVPIEADGINLAALEKLWSEKFEAKNTGEMESFNAVLYLIPLHQNPTGTCLSEEKSRALIALARKYRVLIFCDDVYNLLTYSRTPAKRLFAYDNCSDPDYQGNVISNGTFSKLLSPGLRLGWMELPQWVKHKYWETSPVIDSGGGISQYVGGVVAAALEDGSVHQLLVETRTEMAERLNVLLESLKEHLPDTCRLFCEPTGGYFVFIVLPESVSSAELHRITAKNYGLRFQEGWKFYSGTEPKTEKDHFLRLSWAHVSRADIAEGVQLLCKTIRENSENKRC